MDCAIVQNVLRFWASSQARAMRTGDAEKTEKSKHRAETVAANHTNLSPVRKIAVTLHTQQADPTYNIANPLLKPPSRNRA
jgi:hypothetical protein